MIGRNVWSTISVGSDGARRDVEVGHSDVGDSDVVVLAGPSGSQLAVAAEAIAAGRHVVSVSDGLREVGDLLRLDGAARAARRALVVGAGYSPGLTCVLARHAARQFDVVHEIHVARSGTAGPSCALQHHRSLAGEAVDWWDGRFTDRAGRSGRALVFFPDPVGGLDCYRAGLPETVLLARALPEADRIVARLAATRRDRLTARLRMLRPPHPDGGVGGAHVEVRGSRGGMTDAVVVGAAAQVSVAASVVAAVVARWAWTDRLPMGAGGLATMVEDTVAFLDELADLDLRPVAFDGWSV